MLTRLRLLLHVFVHRCRFAEYVDLALRCKGCKYEPICCLGHYNPR
jgi:hypothetical protein